MAINPFYLFYLCHIFLWCKKSSCRRNIHSEQNWRPHSRKRLVFFVTHRRKILIMSQVMFDKRFERLQQKGIICHFFLLWFVLRLEKKNYSFTTICIQLNNNSIITIQLFQMMGLLSGKISLSALRLEIMDPYLFFGLSEL